MSTSTNTPIPLTIQHDRYLPVDATLDSTSTPLAPLHHLVESYRLHGYRVADLDPLDLTEKPELRELIARPDNAQGSSHDAVAANEAEIDRLEATLARLYCDAIGLDCTGVRDASRRAWLFEWMESVPLGLSEHASRELLTQLIAAEAWEQVASEHVEGAKRFSLQGCESLIPLMLALVDHASKHAVNQMFIGMPHRGRLNALVNVMGYRAKDILSRLDASSQRAAQATDLPYHLGGTTTRHASHGAVTLTMSYNPSHLESAYPVVSGMTRAFNDAHPGQSGVAVVVHGDAAFAGQGVVMETLNMTRKTGYEIGGTIHIVVNNQIGFTTSNAPDALDAVYCTDIGRVVDAPVIHVNADRPEAVMRAAALAFDYRMQFGADIIIDLVGYRRLGHTEHDMPSLTHSYLQSVIASHPTVTELYHFETSEPVALDTLRKDIACELLSDEGADTASGAADTHPASRTLKQSELALSMRTDRPMSMARAASLVAAMTRVPANMRVHPLIETMVERWKKTVSGAHERVDWCLAEHLAFASLLEHGVDIRVAGMDVGRGTFMQRHAVWHSQGRVTGAPDAYIPLRHVGEQQGRFDIFNSPLTEEAALGFEYGYSVQASRGLTMWEAQYGDFVNGAQVFIDQYIASGQAKWGYDSGLVVALPHGHEGVGPEHSNAYLNRFLQLGAEQNMRVVVPSTSSQWFHLLREQAAAKRRTPLVVMSPKSQLYGNSLSHSPLATLIDGQFEPVLGDDTVRDTDAVRRVVLCAGKVFYDLDAARADRKDSAVAIVRIEQLYPFPRAELASVLVQYPNVHDIVWVQEEDRNQGAWRSIREDLEAVVGAGVNLTPICRTSTASGAHASVAAHRVEQVRLVSLALTGEPPRVGLN